MSSPASGTVTEGYLEVPGGRVWYRSVGTASGRAPLLCLHGGPGFTHYYLEPLEALADRRQVIFYDQLGCGNSDRPDDSSLWTVDRFVEELTQVRAALGLEKLHLFGSSWGGMPLLVGGRYDECTPGHLAEMASRIAGAQLEVIENASHLCFAEQPGIFADVVNTFLDRHD